MSEYSGWADFSKNIMTEDKLEDKDELSGMAMEELLLNSMVGMTNLQTLRDILLLRMWRSLSTAEA